MSVSVSHLEIEGSDGFNTVYVGTEPTAFYRSDDGGESWQKMSSFNNLKSFSSWSNDPKISVLETSSIFKIDTHSLVFREIVRVRFYTSL